MTGVNNKYVSEIVGKLIEEKRIEESRVVGPTGASYAAYRLTPAPSSNHTSHNGADKI